MEWYNCYSRYIVNTQFIGSQKELDSSSPQKKEVQINYPKLRRRSSESILNFKEPIWTDLVEVQLPKSKSPRKPKVLKKKKTILKE